MKVHYRGQQPKRISFRPSPGATTQIREGPPFTFKGVFRKWLRPDAGRKTRSTMHLVVRTYARLPSVTEGAQTNTHLNPSNGIGFG
jgi:hypothetical protein